MVTVKDICRSEVVVLLRVLVLVPPHMYVLQLVAPETPSRFRAEIKMATMARRILVRLGQLVILLLAPALTCNQEVWWMDGADDIINSYVAEASRLSRTTANLSLTPTSVPVLGSFGWRSGVDPAWGRARKRRRWVGTGRVWV